MVENNPLEGGLTNIVGYIMEFTNYALVELELPWDSVTFTLWDVIVFEIVTFVVIVCLVVFLKSFSNRIIGE